MSAPLLMLLQLTAFPVFCRQNEEAPYRPPPSLHTLQVCAAAQRVPCRRLR